MSENINYFEPFLVNGKPWYKKGNYVLKHITSGEIIRVSMLNHLNMFFCTTGHGTGYWIDINDYKIIKFSKK